VDILPTILDLAGIENDVPRDGCSLIPPMSDGTPLERHGVRAEYKEEPGGLRYKAWISPEWKLVMYPGEEFGELYNRHDDPYEYMNLFYDRDYSEIKNRMFASLIEDLGRAEVLRPRSSRI
jgi:arylsulfatase A-like enzyme